MDIRLSFNGQKKLGDPGNLVAFLISIGVIGGLGIAAGGVAASKKIKNSSSAEIYDLNKKYTVKKSSTDKAGLALNIGDVFKVLESDGDAILIEIIGNDDNPFFVSAEWLETISDFRKA